MKYPSIQCEGGNDKAMTTVGALIVLILCQNSKCEWRTLGTHFLLLRHAPDYINGTAWLSSSKVHTVQLNSKQGSPLPVNVDV